MVNGELRPALESEVEVVMDRTRLAGSLNIPGAARGIVLFAHGSGSSRHSPRNRFVARQLQEARLATLLLDLLTPEEEAIDWQTSNLRFDIEFLAQRLSGALKWLRNQSATRDLNLGLFGASTGAAAALVTAARASTKVAAVVSRGGRPDLAPTDVLNRVQAPTLFLVGGRDFVVLELNRAAYDELRCEKRLQVIPGATHLFEEPGALEQVAESASKWFETYLLRQPHENRVAD